jgi:N-acetyl-gamma-glutamyl-phosphate reductase
MNIKVAVIGARGYTGSELLPLLYNHPEVEISAVASSSAAGEPLVEHVDGMGGSALRFADIQPENLGGFPADAYILALPNGQAGNYVAAVDRQFPGAVVIDLSADYRFDDHWQYGQPERFANELKGARRIANPGCYATGAQLALLPMAEHVVGVPAVFGVSGYSGAGKTPSRKNDLAALKDNLMPYSLADHVHEREVSRQLGRDIRFLPHVAPFFRGITLTIAAELDRATNVAEMLDVYQSAYERFELIEVQADAPEVTEVRGRHGVKIGGFTVSKSNPSRIAVVCVLDNLLKGAATQAIQNLNLAFGLPPETGLDLKDFTSKVSGPNG